MNRPLVLSVLGFTTALVAVGLALSLNREPQPKSPPMPPMPPLVDVIRIGPGGDAVLAGRASPDNDLLLLDDGQEVAQTTSDHRGDWVAVPSLPFAPGLRLLTIRPAAGPDDTANTVILNIPDQSPTAPILAVGWDEQGRPRLLTGPQGDPGPMNIDMIACDGNGHCTASGRAIPKLTVQLFADDQPETKTTADTTGHWSAALRNADSRRIRADLLNDKGKALVRVSVPLSPPGPRSSQMQVYGGNDWWRIDQAHDHGLMFFQIYRPSADWRSPIRDKK